MLPLEDSLYDSVKATILCANEMVPDACSQRFRNHKCAPNQAYVDFTREKGALFDKWSTTCKATDFKSLQQLILLEEFNNCLPDLMVVYFNEQKVKPLFSAAVLANDYVLSHKNVFLPICVKKSHRALALQNSLPKLLSSKKDERECFYHQNFEHVIANCLTLKRKEH